MKAFLASVAIAIVLAGAGFYGLDTQLQRQSDQAFTSPTSVRLPVHGDTTNLVGKDWYSAADR
jgi:hypothetical protein